MFKFEKRLVWQRSILFADVIYENTRKFPDDEEFALTNQIRRAAISISSNNAEGTARPDPDFARFIGYSAGSLYEVISQATIARNRKYLTNETLSQIHDEGEEINRMLSGLRDSLGGPLTLALNSVLSALRSPLSAFPA